MKVNKNIWVGKSKPYNKNSLHFPNGINSDVDSGGVKYYKGTLGIWGEAFSCCPVFMPLKISGDWGIYPPVLSLFGDIKQGLFADGKTTIIKSYSGNADFRDSPFLSEFGFRSFEEYIEFVRTQGAEMGINEEFTEITEEEFYTLFEQIKTQNE